MISLEGKNASAGFKDSETNILEHIDTQESRGRDLSLRKIKDIFPMRPSTFWIGYSVMTTKNVSPRVKLKRTHTSVSWAPGQPTKIYWVCFVDPVRTATPSIRPDRESDATASDWYLLLCVHFGFLVFFLHSRRLSSAYMYVYGTTTPNTRVRHLKCSSNLLRRRFKLIDPPISSVPTQFAALENQTNVRWRLAHMRFWTQKHERRPNKPILRIHMYYAQHPQKTQNLTVKYPRKKRKP